MIFKRDLKTVNDIEELKRYLKSILPVNKGGIISVDGKDGCGKTYVSKYLTTSFSLLHIELDKFIKEKKDKFIDFINYKELALTINEALKCNHTIIIDGVCVLSVLQRLKLNPKYSIYVKRTNNRGCWLDAHYFDLESSPEVIFKKDKEELREFSKLINQKYSEDEDDDLFHEIIKYHFDFKPHIKSDIIFENIQPK